MNTGVPGAAQITIGMPVYNGAAHVRAAIDSLLAQTFRDFELLISDNGSTDATAAICEEYVRRDARVRYVRQPENRGATFNWNFVARQARSPYFKWAAGNDICPPYMLEHCLQELRAHPEFALCYGNTAQIDDSGAVFGQQESDPEILDASACTRFVRVTNELICNNAQSGLIRMSALRKTRLDREYLDGDMVLMAELALYGGFRKLEEVFLFRRLDRGSFSSLLPDAERQRMLTARTSTRWPPVLRRHLDRVFTVCRASLPWREKRGALGYVLRSAYWDRTNIASGVRNSLFPPRVAQR
ncbi:MAG TPA: glycosyltransferase [Steroidobacteraceae bacterium]|jgi:glycosyltransferase involved in cell wall biosynthesis|nr:glycosyltransferase [Steroidobacteraceae bacterium]